MELVNIDEQNGKIEIIPSDIFLKKWILFKKNFKIHILLAGNLNYLKNYKLKQLGRWWNHANYRCKSKKDS
jgi:hypothetical protein